MNQNHERLETLAAAYALGALDGDERREFEAHLAQGCARCAATLSRHAETLATLASLAPPVVSPPEIKQALFERIVADAPRRARARRPWLSWAVATAAAAIVSAWFTGAFVAVRYEAELGRMARERMALGELLRDPATQVVALHGLGPSPAATGRVIWHPRAGGHAFVANLPPSPPGKAYELWTIGDAGPRPAGVFRVDTQGRGSHRLAPADSGRPVKVFAVTLEPEAGVPAPTGPIVLASK